MDCGPGDSGFLLCNHLRARSLQPDGLDLCDHPGNLLPPDTAVVLHTLSGALANSLAFILGGLWAAALSLFLWPLDPFRPARIAVGECYNLLSAFTAGVHNTAPDSEDRQQQRHLMHELQRSMRLQMEAARAAIGTTGARVTARTIRARSLHGVIGDRRHPLRRNDSLD